MTVYLVNILLLLAWAALLLWHRPDRVKRALFCMVASAQWIAISGLRHPSVGADTSAYRDWFYRILATPWSQVLGSLWGTFFGGLGARDPGYPVFVKTVQLVTHEYQVFLIIVAALFMIPLGLLVYRHSADPFISFMIYSTLFFEFFAITGIRQTIATALAVLIGYTFVVKRQVLPFLVVSAVAFTIHKSALVFVPFYLLANVNLTQKHMARVFVAMPFVFALRSPIGYFFASTFYPQDQYLRAYEGAGTWTFTAMLVLVAVIALVRFKRITSSDALSRSWYVALLLALLSVPLTFRNPSAMRVVQYFTLFLMLLIPAIVNTLKTKEERMLGYWAAAAVLGALLVRKSPEYLFFWQGF